MIREQHVQLLRARRHPSLRGLSPEARLHVARCSTARPPSEVEVAHLIAEYLSRGGEVTRVRTAYVAPTSAARPAVQEAGCEAGTAGG